MPSARYSVAAGLITALPRPTGLTAADSQCAIPVHTGSTFLVAARRALPGEEAGTSARNTAALAIAVIRAACLATTAIITSVKIVTAAYAVLTIPLPTTILWAPLLLAADAMIQLYTFALPAAAAKPMSRTIVRATSLPARYTFISVFADTPPTFTPSLGPVTSAEASRQRACWRITLRSPRAVGEDVSEPSYKHGTSSGVHIDCGD